MSLYSVLYAVNALGALIMAVAILVVRSPQPVQLAYSALSAVLALWSGLSFIWSVQTTPTGAAFWIKTMLYPACLGHAVTFHFTLLFTGRLSGYRRVLWAAYIISGVLVVVNLHHGFVAAVRPRPPFLFYPQASGFVSGFLAVQAFYVALSIAIMAQAVRSAQPPHRTRLGYAILLTLVGWTGAWTNWGYYYDLVRIPPIGNVAILAFLIAAAYLIFTEDALELHLAAQTTVVYTLLTLCLTLVYTGCVILSTKLLERWIGYSSIIGSLLAGLAIAIGFNPLRERIIRVVDRLLFGKTIVELSTENQRMREELLKQDRLKAVATLAAGMAHEIRNPLTAIKVFAERLTQQYDDPEFRTDFRRTVIDEVQRISGILQHLLEFSKPQPPALTPVRMVPIVDDTVRLLGTSLRDHQVAVTTHYDADPILMIDPHQIRQALLNVLLNSIEAMPHGGTLQIRTAIEPLGRFCITLADTGVGIREDDQPHVFDPFFTTKDSGTGLGLAIVHSIVTQHGGAVRLTSQYGHGTTIQIFLRLQSGQPT